MSIKSQINAALNRSDVVIIKGVECHIEFGRYRNGTVAMQATIADQTDLEFGQPFATLSVNWEANWQGATPYAEFFKFPSVVIKNYSENEGILDDLVKAGVLTRGAYLGGSNGKVEACLLTPKWEKIASAKPN